LPGFTELLIYAVIVFTLNVVPAFAPPTWMALSWIGFAHPQYNPFAVALFAAAAATAGRVVLAKLARAIIRRRIMGEASRANIEVIKEAIERRRGLTAGTLVFFAFSPFASNFLFIAYGLTSSPVRLVALPFFLGRFASYSFFVFAAAEVSQRLALNGTDAKNYFGIYFIASQFLLMGAVWLFTRIDWKYALTSKRLRWLRAMQADR
jgi:membrane protein YqaA with SNARE-associated domain